MFNINRQANDIGLRTHFSSSSEEFQMPPPLNAMNGAALGNGPYQTDSRSSHESDKKSYLKKVVKFFFPYDNVHKLLTYGPFLGIPFSILAWRGEDASRFGIEEFFNGVNDNGVKDKKDIGFLEKTHKIAPYFRFPFFGLLLNDFIVGLAAKRYPNKPMGLFSNPGAYSDITPSSTGTNPVINVFMDQAPVHNMGTYSSSTFAHNSQGLASGTINSSAMPISGSPRVNVGGMPVITLQHFACQNSSNTLGTYSGSGGAIDISYI